MSTERGMAQRNTLCAMCHPSRWRGLSLKKEADRAKTRWITRPSDSVRARVSVESGMAHISGFERSQILLLPEAVDDYVGSDNPVRFIDAFVDGLDLVEEGFERVQPKGTGRPGY